MAKYTKTTTEVDGKPKVQYMNGKTPVDGKDVPDVVRNALNEVKEGTVVDELGDVFNPETDIDESEDETADQATDSDDDLNEEDLDDDEDDQEEEQKPAAKAAKKAEKPAPRPRPRRNTDDGSGEEGMGFPRVNGKTVDIFDGKTPHTHIRNVAGFVVPMSEDSFNNRTDAEVMEKLKELGKI